MKHDHNSLAHYTQGCIRGIFSDGRWMYSKESEWERDQTRLLRQLEVRREWLITVELPGLCKHLDRCLDEGTYTNPKTPLSRARRKGEQIPTFLREVFLRVFTNEGKLLGDPCHFAILWLRTVLSFAKKLEIACSKDRIDEEIENFFSLDASIPNPDLRWDWDTLDVERLNRDDLYTWRNGHFHLWKTASFSYRRIEEQPDLFPQLQDDSFHQWRGGGELWELADRIQSTFDVVASQYGLAPHLRGADTHTDSRPGHGPGAVSDLSARDSKYEFRNWPDKLQRTFPHDEYALPSLGQGFSCEGEQYHRLNREIPSKLLAVPKTQKVPRLIAAEPSSHMWVQQFLSKELMQLTTNGLLSRSIDFWDQSHNMRMALEGSKSGKFATIDLSEASDRVSCALVERFWRANPGWLVALHACRTRWVSYADGLNKRYHLLRKFAPQGSAITFPLESIIFASIAIGATLYVERRRASIANIKACSRKVRVFGDDIIVRTKTLGAVIQGLQMAGLKVNITKTYGGENFRESCGMDAFRGTCVTPPRLKRIPETGLGGLSSLVALSNNFHKKGFWCTAKFIRDSISRFDHLIPISREPTGGLFYFSFTGSKMDHLKFRWNPDLQRHEYRALKTLTRDRRVDRLGHERLLKYFTEEPSPQTKWTGELVVRKDVVIRPGWLA